MAQDNYTEVSSESWFSRIGGAFKGILFGAVLFGLSFVILFWNEGRAVQTFRALQEGSRTVIDVAVDRVDPANEGKLVHVSGKAVTASVVKDPEFQVSANALKLARHVEVYQWKESTSSSTEKNLGGGTETTRTYSYSKEWSRDLIDSARFKVAEGHQNPPALPAESGEWLADPVTLGAFILNPRQVARAGVAVQLPVSAELADKPAVKVHGGGYYMGKDPANPQVGDARITFKVTNPSDVSVVSRQAGSSFASYTASNGKTIDLLVNGLVPADSMFNAAQDSNRTLTLVLRIVGFLMMYIGLSLVLRPLSVLADVIPFLGSIVGVGTGIIAFLVSVVLSLTTIAIAWIVYRPLVGISLLVLGGGVAYLIRKKIQARKLARTGAAGSPANC